MFALQAQLQPTPSFPNAAVASPLQSAGTVHLR
jgi:hypothetical protein